MAELAHKEIPTTVKWEDVAFKLINKPKTEKGDSKLVVVHGSNLSAYHNEFT